MKKFSLTIATILLSTSIANAKSYIGLEAQSTSLSLSAKSVALSGSSFTPATSEYYDDQAYNPAIFVGTELAPNLDVELNYSHSSFSKTNNNTGLIIASTSTPLNTKSEIKLDNLALDFKPKYVYQDLSVYAIIGVSLVRADVTEDFYGNGFSSQSSQTKTGMAYSVGAGAQYALTKDVVARIQAKYTKTDLDFGNLTGLKSIDNIKTVAVGAAYIF